MYEIKKITIFFSKIIFILMLNLFRLSGLDIQSQTAYDLAVKGPIRPADPKVPMIYTIKCINFEPPYFTLGK